MWHSRNHEESSGYRHCSPRHGHFRAGFGRWGHGGWGAGGGDGPGGFGRRRGLYDSEELRLVLLSLIADQPRHGYELNSRDRGAHRRRLCAQSRRGSIPPSPCCRIWG